MSSDQAWEAVHCSLTVRRPAEGVVVLVYRGADVGELGDRPFRALEGDLAADLPIELWVDARATLGASMDVSGAWASFLARHRARIHRVTFLCGTDLLEVTGAFVARVSGLGGRMRLFRDPAAFDAALAAACDPGVER